MVSGSLIKFLVVGWDAERRAKEQCCHRVEFEGILMDQ